MAKNENKDNTGTTYNSQNIVINSTNSLLYNNNVIGDVLPEPGTPGRIFFKKLNISN